MQIYTRIINQTDVSERRVSQPFVDLLLMFRHQPPIAIHIPKGPAFAKSLPWRR